MTCYSYWLFGNLLQLRPEHRPARNLTREEMATLVLVISLRIDTTLVSLSKTYFETCQTSMI